MQQLLIFILFWGKIIARGRTIVGKVVIALLFIFVSFFVAVSRSFKVY